MTPPPPQQPTSYLNQSSGDYLRSQLGAMKNGVYATMVAPDRTQAWDADQLVLQRRINDLAQQADTSVDPQSVIGSDEFEHLTLEQIRDLTYAIKPEIVQAVSEAWGKIGSELADATRILSDGLRTTIANNWEGEAAGRAAESLGQFADTSGKIGQSATMVGLKVSFAQRSSDETLRMLGPVLAAAAPVGPPIQLPGLPPMGPAPIPGASTSVIPMLAGQQNADSQKEEARQACLQVLRNVYSPGIHGGDQGVPLLPSVRPAANPAAPSVAGVTASGPTAPTSGAAAPVSGGPGNQQPDSENGQPPTTPAQDPGAPATTAAGLGQPSTPGLGNSNPVPGLSSSSPSTISAGFDPNSGSGGSPSLPGFGSSRGGSAGGLGSGTSQPGRPGASAPGKPSPMSAPTAGAPGPGRSGVPGSPGMSPGMMGQGARGKSDDDKEHKSPDLLRGQHLEEWIHNGQKVMPAFGAIGEEESPGQSRNRPPGSPSDAPGHNRLSGEYR